MRLALARGDLSDAGAQAGSMELISNGPSPLRNPR